MSFEFQYEPEDESGSGRHSGDRGSRHRRAVDYWRRLPGWGKGTTVVVFVLVASTIITSRDPGPDRRPIEQTAASAPAAETNPVTTARPAPVETEPRPTTTAVSNTSGRPPPATTAAPASAPALSTTEVDWAELALSVVYIEAGECPSFPSDMFNSGSGTVVLDGGHVLTNAHVVLDDEGQPCRDVVVWFTRSFEEAPSDPVLADLAAADRTLDLAVLQLSRPVSAGRGIEVAEQQLEPGETIRILGYPDVGGLTMTLTMGVYSGMLDYGSERYIKTDTDISEGSSGGAGFDEAGVFIGVPTGGVEQVGLLIPAGVAEQFLDRGLG